MKQNVPQELVDLIQNENFFCLLGHAEPDGDCIGAQLALANFLTRLGKRVELYSPGPFDRVEIQPSADRFKYRIPPESLALRPAVIVLDCSSLDRIGALAEDVDGLPALAVIDHHSAGHGFGSIHFIDPAAPSVTLLVQRLIEHMGYGVDAEEACWILFGFCTDTGFFRHLDTPDPAVFEAVGRLAAVGATPKQIYYRIFGGRPLPSRILLGRLLARTEAAFGGRLLYTYETLEEKRSFGTAVRDSDSVYQFLQTVVDCEIVVLIREEDADTCTVGLRSNAFVDVGAVAEGFGGGGHKRAAGFEWHGTRSEAQKRVFDALSTSLS